MRRRLLAIGGLVVVALAVGAFVLTRGDDRPSAQLLALQDDPMGTYVPRGAKLLRATARNERSTGTFSKSKPAKYTRVFSVPSETAEPALREAIGMAQAAGWQLTPVGGGTAAVGRKQLPTGRGVLTISLSGEPVTSGGVEGATMHIVLQHGSG